MWVGPDKLVTGTSMFMQMERGISSGAFPMDRDIGQPIEISSIMKHLALSLLVGLIKK